MSVLTLNGSAVAQQRTVITGLTDRSGVAFHYGALFVADRTRIVRFENIEQQLDYPGAPVTVIAGLPDNARHNAHAMPWAWASPRRHAVCIRGLALQLCL